MTRKYSPPPDFSIKAALRVIGLGVRYTVFAVVALWWLSLASCAVDNYADNKRSSAFRACQQSDTDECMATKGYKRFNLACGNQKAQCYVSRYRFWID